MPITMALPILAAGKHLLTMNAVARTTEEAQDMARAAAARPDLVALIYPGQFYLREDALVRHYLEGELYVGRVLQVVDRWHTPFFGLASQFEVILRWFGDHRRMIGHRKSFGFEVPGRGGAMTRAEANTVVAELVSDGIVLYEHNNATGTFGETCIDVSGSEGRLVCYPVGQRQEVVYGAKKGEQELKPLPVPEHLQDSLANGVPIEADFIAAVRGDHSPSPSIPRFQDGVKLMSFADAWRQSATTSTWCDLSS